MMKATYRLNQLRANFNFLEFLVVAATEGATHIVFDRNKPRRDYPEPELKARISSILEPACALAGCSFSYGEELGISPGYHISTVIKAFERHGRIAKLKSVLPPKSVEYTVTLRNCDKDAYRNSDDVWRDFAEEIGAFVIEDYYDKPISLHERMSYYAGAKMNYFVANGPATMCWFSDYPHTTFMKGVLEDYHMAHGFWRNQLPWAKPNQRCVWRADTIEQLRKHAPQRLAA